MRRIIQMPDPRDLLKKGILFSLSQSSIMILPTLKKKNNKKLINQTHQFPSKRSPLNGRIAAKYDYCNSSIVHDAKCCTILIPTELEEKHNQRMEQ